MSLTYSFRDVDHQTACDWIKSQNYLKGSIHESFEGWVETHGSLKKWLSEHPFWVGAYWGDELVAIYYSAPARYPERFDSREQGLYDGFLVVKPNHRKQGLGRKLEDYRIQRTRDLFNWKYNWTLAKPELLEFNLKLGYQHYEKTDFGYYLLWRT